MKDRKPCISVFIAYLTILSRNQEHQPRHDNSIPCMTVWQIYRVTEQPEEKEASQNESRLRFSQRKFQQQSPNPIRIRKSTPGSSKMVFHQGFIQYIGKIGEIFQKTNISYPLIRTRTCAYQGVINLSFFGKFCLRTY